MVGQAGVGLSCFVLSLIPKMSLYTLARITESGDFSFHDLVQAIQLAHDQLAGQAAKAVNVSLTMRNWTIGMYISEYELKGADRAEYGEKLLTELSKRLKTLEVTGTGQGNYTIISRFTANLTFKPNYVCQICVTPILTVIYAQSVKNRFYRTYPEIVQTVPTQMEEHIHKKTRLAEKVWAASAPCSNRPISLILPCQYPIFTRLYDFAGIRAEADRTKKKRARLGYKYPGWREKVPPKWGRVYHETRK